MHYFEIGRHGCGSVIVTAYGPDAGPIFLEKYRSKKAGNATKFYAEC